METRIYKVSILFGISSAAESDVGNRRHYQRLCFTVNKGVDTFLKDDFLAGIAKREAFFHSLGFQFVKIVPLQETRLDTHYVMVKVHAQMRFEKIPGQAIDMNNDSVYILFIKNDAPKIVFNLTHGDLMKIMQEHGLLPEKR